MIGPIAENYYVNGKISCAQSIFLAASDEYNLGLTKEDAKLVSAFGGGIGCVHICGALAGALSVMGKILIKGDGPSPEFRAAATGFLKEFEQEFGSTMCAQLTPKYKTEDRHCADLVLQCGNLLEKYLNEILKDEAK